MLGQSEKEVGFRAAGAQRGDTSMGRAEELARITERMPQRLVRFADVLQVRGESVDEFERGQLALYGQHAASG
jgi:hypothetical protein